MWGILNKPVMQISLLSTFPKCRKLGQRNRLCIYFTRLMWHIVVNIHGSNINFSRNQQSISLPLPSLTIDTTNTGHCRQLFHFCTWSEINAMDELIVSPIWVIPIVFNMFDPLLLKIILLQNFKKCQQNFENLSHIPKKVLIRVKFFTILILTNQLSIAERLYGQEVFKNLRERQEI